MTDGEGRTIDYLRISVTDRCNLRCAYCMPEEGVAWMPHDMILRYEEILRLCRIFGEMGVSKFKLTGGEPLVRRGLERLVAGLKALPNTRSVTITTNGVLLEERLPVLLDAGLDGVNISLDTLDRERYRALTRRDGLGQALASLDAALAVPGLNVKVNCVPREGGREDWIALAELAREKLLAVRFIELMPIGRGRGLSPCTEGELRGALEAAYGPMAPYEGPAMGNGPCRYAALPGFAGKIGFISAMSHQFCRGCNRVRLTANGFLKTCLQYETGVALRPLLTQDDSAIRAAIETAVQNKPAAHQFARQGVENGEEHNMNQIGG